jgi:CO/xanthine dehydrogenase FAD-binding subunit
MKLPPFEYRCPTTVADAVAILAAHNGDARPIAGGQSLMPMMAFRLAAPSVLVDLRKISGLNHIAVGADGVHLGARVRWRDILDSAELRTAHPLLVAAIAEVSHYQIRNRGTVGGSLAHADPAAEMPGIALTCDATIEIAGAKGSRTVAAKDFFLGALTTALEPDELITGVRLAPWPKKRRWAFLEFARRRGDFALAGVALHYDLAEQGGAANVHIGAIGVANRPLRLTNAEAAIEARALDAASIVAAARAASAEVDPVDDIHADAQYRRALVGTLLERALSASAHRSES